MGVEISNSYALIRLPSKFRASEEANGSLIRMLV